MRRPDLEQKTLDYINSYYEAVYTGLLEIHKIDEIYKLILGVPSYMFPTVISMDSCTDEEFLDFLYKEFRVRNYMRLYIYKTTRINDTEEGQ
jgi:hypothetical protein